MVTVTVPFPVPNVGFAPRPEADHEHDWLDAVTDTGTLAPAAGICVRFDGLMVNEQADPNCVIE
jgi:hypothetical protein